jgi:hypothetical protein
VHEGAQAEDGGGEHALSVAQVGSEPDHDVHAKTDRLPFDGTHGTEPLAMLGLTNGELFVVVFIVVAVVSAPWWPRMGEALFKLLTRPRRSP